VRSELNVPPGREIAAFQSGGAVEASLVEKHLDHIRRLGRLGDIKPARGEEWDRIAVRAVQVVVEGMTLHLDLADVVDLAKERQRLQKEAAALHSELEKIDKKLGNEQFRAKAKPEVIEEQQERRSETEAAIQRLTDALARFRVA
jgi:valyl-tRNA synthetase